MAAIGIPLASCADQTLARYAAATNSSAVSVVDGATLLGERAMLRGATIPKRVSAGAGCRLFDAADDTIALNLARTADRELLPALFETDELNCHDDTAIADCIARCDAAALVLRGRSMGLAIAAGHEQPGQTTNNRAAGHEQPTAGGRGAPRERPGPTAGACASAACVAPPRVEMVADPAAPAPARGAPRVLDLSALWAGPLASHLLWLAGADVVKVESRTRPDGMRANAEFFALLNQGKASVALNFAEPNDRQRLLSMIADADIVIEAARPRALAQLGIDAARIIRAQPGLVWVTITGHGTEGEAANWVGFGDDCGVSGGLTAALHAACGETGFVGDAIADPLTGLNAALVAWEAWAAGRGGRFGLSMSQVVAENLATARRQDAAALNESLSAWGRAAGKPFPTVNRRPIGALSASGAPAAFGALPASGALPAFGAQTRSYMPNQRGAQG